MTIAIRAIDRKADRRAVSAITQIDTSFEASSVYDVVVGARAIELVARPLATPLVKRYPMADALAAWSTWDTGFASSPSSPRIRCERVGAPSRPLAR